ncbi:methylamine utilization protein [Hahella ganghwensis]|uniref:methylamine utilization protein n=1 Tax=Hahella ganghwensis TaxID=286420 RepID=UPI000361232C|nr:methylamine utilization protein [Hahella ganghwensis]
MFNNLSICLICFIAGLAASQILAPGSAIAEDPQYFRFQVVDDKQQPVANAVVELVTDTSSPPAMPQVRMDQVNKSFVPHVLAITKGQSVSFPNSDQIRHHVYSFSPPKPFEIRLYAGTPGEPVEFEKAGVVVLGCNIHDRMVGYIYIGDTVYTGTSDTRGEVLIPVPADFSAVRLWHSQLSLDGQTRLTLLKSELKRELSPEGDPTYQLKLPLTIRQTVQPTNESKDLRNKFQKFGS